MEEVQAGAAPTPTGIMNDTFKSTMDKFMHYHFTNHQFTPQTQNHYLPNYLWKPKDLGICHVVAHLQKTNCMFPYFLVPSNSKLLEGNMVESVLQIIPA
eukprot:7150560-Ditylum_brightwellii.AAC.1